MIGWDAVSTGRRVRMTEDTHWYQFQYAVFHSEGTQVRMGQTELDSDHWMVEPKEILITKEKLAEAWNSGVAGMQLPSNTPVADAFASGLFSRLVAALGL